MNRLVPKECLKAVSIVLSLSAALLSHAAPPPDRGPHTTIVNSGTNPVPVVQQGPVSISGGVTLSGTPNVNVANTAAAPVPVSQQGPLSISGGVTINGTPNVNVANTPTVNLVSGATVKITADTPVPVTTSSGQLVRITVLVNQPQIHDLPLYTVPFGKRLLIDYINIGASSSTYFRVTKPTLVSTFVVPLDGQGNGSAKVQIPLEAGEQLALVSIGTSSVWLIGTLVDASQPILDIPIFCCP